MTLLAAYKILLARRSQQSDVLVASPVANRARRQTEPLLGCFVNMLLLRPRLDGDPTLGERQGLEGLLLYDADLFDASTIVELIADYRYLLEEISAHPERRLSSLTAPEDTVANGLAVPSG